MGKKAAADQRMIDEAFSHFQESDPYEENSDARPTIDLSDINDLSGLSMDEAVDKFSAYSEFLSDPRVNRILLGDDLVWAAELNVQLKPKIAVGGSLRRHLVKVKDQK